MEKSLINFVFAIVLLSKSFISYGIVEKYNHDLSYEPIH